jgi:D-alanyl-D-alanine carboxypeptidase/D-alanyl-D-alanine-endopeptidase (penicillin-binding protein 4)
VRITALAPRDPPRGEGRLKLARTLPALTVGAALVVLAATIVPAGAAPLLTLEVSPQRITYGGTVALSGAVQDDPACMAGREARLAWSPTGIDPWTARASTATGADGSYTFDDPPPATGWYRVELAAAGTCLPLVSPPVRVAVRARVDASVLASTLTAGSCPSVTAHVSPPKPGQRVELQRRTHDGWQVVEVLSLDAGSSVTARPCFGYDDVGIVRIRVAWPAQDDATIAGASPALAFRIEEAPWMRRIDALIGGRSVSVEVELEGTTLYRHAPDTPRIPASNEKLLLSMALLDQLGPGYRISTLAAAAAVRDGVVPGNLWILGRGDPEIRPARMAALARRLADAGVTAVRGRVMGAVSYFRHDWWAKGWHPGIRRYVAPPTALTFDGNRTGSGYTRAPERLAAGSLTRRLRALGISVRGLPGGGTPPSGLTEVAAIRSRSLRTLLVRMDRPSDNFYAEVLGKLLAATTEGPPGTIAKAAGQIRSWAASHGVRFSLYDASGLSYANRVTAAGIVRLLGIADGEPWGPVLRGALPTGGQGTLEDRLSGVRVRAKTGTLDGVSALSGWVWLRREGAWAEFSILSSLPKWSAVTVEDGIVRTLAAKAR